jgi:predicted nuclease of predicted toxin-antitoxin system
MKWLADECFDNDIVRGLLRHSPGFDLIRVQDVSQIAGGDDGIVLARAAKNERVALTHDVSTMART